MQLFRSQKAVICCGQGAWEQPDTTWYLKRIFEAKHIPIWVDLWGHDVKHDWDWWLGLGASPPEPEWGRVLAEGMPYLERAYWVVLAPAVALAVLSVMGVSLAGLTGQKK